jgi:hypothetical protein
MVGLLKTILLFKVGVKVLARRRTEELIILGNGPSLKLEKEDLLRIRSSRSVLAVNYFASTLEFEQFKPEYYVLISLEFWQTEIKKEWSDNRLSFFKDLLSKTDWEMDLFVPVQAKKDKDWIRRMTTNSKITLHFFNSAPLDDHPKFFSFLLKKYWACPRPHNVMIPSILIAINLGFTKVILSGSDHSWLPEITVNEDNIVMIGQKHFYGDQRIKNDSSLFSDQPKPMYKSGSNDQRRLHEVLIKFYYSFKAYWFLKEYGKINNTHVVNITQTSFVDAFDKVNVHDITT